MRSLLQRLAETASRREDETATLESIRANLEVILGAVRGASPSAPGLGVVNLALVDVTQDARRPVEEGLRRMIEIHEPRLTDVRVKFSSPDVKAVRLSFEIQARVVSLRRGPRAAVFRSSIEDSGAVDVRFR